MPLIAEHIWISGIAIAAATVIGICLGVFISRYRVFKPYILGATNVIYTIPSIALFGFLIPFTGIGNKTAIIALILYALLPMVRNTYTGLTNISPSILESAEGMGSSPRQMLFKIKLPIAMPVILSGFRNMAVMTIALAGIASYIGAGGLGKAIYRGITTNNIAMTLAGSLLIAAMALSADYILSFSEKLISKRKFFALKIIFVILAIFTSVIIASGISGGDKKIKIATKPMTEQFIIGEMLKILIEDRTPLKVQIFKGIGGGTSNIHPALLKGDFDMYPEYTGTAWKFVLKREDSPAGETLIKIMEKEYKDKFGLIWTGFYGFNNRFGLGLRKDIAEKYDIETYSDLAPYSSKLALGAEYDFFERDDGYDALKKAYGYNFKKNVDMDIGLKYSAINSKKVDVINLFTTDALVSVSNIRLLKDDKGFFANYYIGTVVRIETLEKYPELIKVLEIMEGLINDDEMSKMNYQVEAEKMTDKETARRFLIAKGLIKEAQ